MEEYFNEVTEKFMQNEQGFFEIDLVRKDGSLVPVEVNAHLFTCRENRLFSQLPVISLNGERLKQRLKKHTSVLKTYLNSSPTRSSCLILKEQ